MVHSTFLLIRMTFRILRKRFPANPPHFPANTYRLYFTRIQKLVHQIFPYPKRFHGLFCGHKIRIFFKHFHRLLIFPVWIILSLNPLFRKLYLHIIFMERNQNAEICRVIVLFRFIVSEKLFSHKKEPHTK